MAIIIGNLFVSIYLTYLLIYILTMIFSKMNRVETKTKNVKLSRLRKINEKSIKQQKEFISLKFPKTPPWKFSWKWLWLMLKNLFVFIVTITIINRIFFYFKVIIPVWLALIILIFMPIIINVILKKFNLESNDISVFFR